MYRLFKMHMDTIIHTIVTMVASILFLDSYLISRPLEIITTCIMIMMVIFYYKNNKMIIGIHKILFSNTFVVYSIFLILYILPSTYESSKLIIIMIVILLLIEVLVSEYNNDKNMVLIIESESLDGFIFGKYKFISSLSTDAFFINSMIIIHNKSMFNVITNDSSTNTLINFLDNSKYNKTLSVSQEKLLRMFLINIGYTEMDIVTIINKLKLDISN